MVRKVQAECLFELKNYEFRDHNMIQLLYTGCYIVRSVHVPKIMIEFKMFLCNVMLSCFLYRTAITFVDVCSTIDS